MYERAAVLGRLQVILEGKEKLEKDRLKILLEKVAKNEVSVPQALTELSHLPYEDLGFAKIDHHRSLRLGFPEVIFCQGKTTEQILEITRRLVRNHQVVLATRASSEVFQALKELPEAHYSEVARLVTIGQPSRKTTGKVAVLCAGTADVPVAEEAALTAEAVGSRVERLYDVGVAGMHRLLDNREKLLEARVVVAVAGMEGALASVVGGLVDKPVIAVPTSIGYGASFGGLAALLGMLNSCAPGVAVVNIDNGFGAGYLASLINKLGEGEK